MTIEQKLKRKINRQKFMASYQSNMIKCNASSNDDECVYYRSLANSAHQRYRLNGGR